MALTYCKQSAAKEYVKIKFNIFSSTEKSAQHCYRIILINLLISYNFSFFFALTQNYLNFHNLNYKQNIKVQLIFHLQKLKCEIWHAYKRE